MFSEFLVKFIEKFFFLSKLKKYHLATLQIHVAAVVDQDRKDRNPTWGISLAVTQNNPWESAIFTDHYWTVTTISMYKLGDG